MATKIEWTEETWNIAVGCTKVSPGCANCYAERMAKRLKGAGLPQYQDVVDESGWTGQVSLVENAMRKPVRWRKPRRVFPCSMGDLFHKGVPTNFIRRAYWNMIQTQHHTYQILTKRVSRMCEVMTSEMWKMDLGVSPNVWIGGSIERSDYSWRSRYIVQVPATVHFVSFEPLLGPMDTHPGVLDRIDWAIIGCESGPNRRPCNIEWVRGLVQMAQSARVLVFVKQLEIDGKVNKNPADWPADLRVRQYPNR